MFNLGLCAFCVLVAGLSAGGALGEEAQLKRSVPVAKPGFSLVEERIGEASIPAFVLCKEGNSEAKKPAVILVHGGSVIDGLMTPGLPFKEEWFRPVYEDVPYRLAGNGMVVVAIDAAWAESRHTANTRDEVMKNPGMAVFSYFFKGVEDVSQAIDYLISRGDVDTGRIAVAGKSGGGIVSLMAACQEPRLNTVVAWKAGAKFIETTRLRGQGALLDSIFEKNPEFRDELERHDPMNSCEKIPPKALAMINNKEDPLMPRQSAEGLYEKLLPLYKDHPGRIMLKLCETNKPTHDDQVEAFEAGCEWLEKHLLPTNQ